MDYSTELPPGANVHSTLVNYFTYCTLGPWVRVRVRVRARVRVSLM